MTAEAGLSFRLGEGAEAPARASTAPPAPATPLSAAEAERVLQRLPELPKEPTPPPFALRESSLPPPRTGVTVKDAFPAPAEKEGPGFVAAPGLEVLRHTPDGEVPLVPNVGITFSQPMVEVTSHAELEKAAVPARLTPQPPGRWSWLGTRTLVFEPAATDAAARLPMATEYQLEVPAGARSATGGVLAQAARWRIGTPPPSLTESWPSEGTVRRDSLFLAAFDQRVDAAAVLATVRVSAGGSTYALRPATREEVAADEEASRRAREAGEGRWLAFRTAQPLPAGTEVKVVVGPGTPSAEGPRKTTKPQSWSVRTFGPLKKLGQQCGWNDECRPGTPFRLQLSNSIDAESFRPEMVRVEPPLPALAVDVLDDWLHVRGRMKGATRYTVTLAPELRDVFGQALAAPARAVFTTRRVMPQLVAAASSGFVVLDPSGPKRFSVWSVNHPRLHATAYAVTPADWPAFLQYQHGQRRNQRGAKPSPPGRRVIDTSITVRGPADELVETRIDLAPALTNGLGHVALVVEPDPNAPPQTSNVTVYPGQPVMSWVQATHIGLTAFVDESDLLAWTTALDDGAPLGGVELELLPALGRAQPAADGVARLPLPDANAYALVARRGADSALLPAQTGWWSPDAGWKKRPQRQDLRWSISDDRGMYRPGEEVRVKGWARSVGTGKGGDVMPWDGSIRDFAYTVSDAQGNAVARGRAAFNAYGGFDLTLELPPTMNLGMASILLQPAAAPDTQAGQHTFQVQEFRRPEYEVTASISQAPHFVGGSATVTVSALYYAGGSLADAPVNWRVASSTTTFRPPNRDDFTFGRWVPWWEFVPGAAERVRSLEGRTDPSGKHTVRIDFDAVEPPLPSSVRAEASVTDVNRQAWSAGGSLLVHPADVYVGLRTDKPFVERGAAYAVEAIVTDLDGAAVAGRAVEIVAERLEWTHGAQGWHETSVDAGRCSLASTDGAFRCALQAGEGGTYRLSATVRDAKGRPNLTEIRLWVSGGKLPERRGLEQDEVTLVPGKQEYRAGETAEILVVAPFAPAEGLMTLRRSGVVRTESFHVTGSTHTLRVPIDDALVPNVHVQVDLVGAVPRQEGKPPTRPAFASGTVPLRVPPLSRTLAVSVAARDKALEPGGKTTIDVALNDAAGHPVPQGEVALWVVDEAVLALTGYTLPDPLSVFYAPRGPETSDLHLRAHLVLSKEPELGDLSESVQVSAGTAAAFGVPDGAMPAPPPPQPAQRPAPMKKAGAGAAEPIRMRSDFRALALFAASVVTDAQGRAEVPLSVPDNLTRYRVLAVAATPGREFGARESTLSVRLPLMVRPSPPRFLNFGDRLELPVVVQNQTESPLAVDVAVEAQGVKLTAGAGRRVAVPANGRVEVRFPMAVEHVGTARIGIGAASGSWADAAQVEFPVWTPATSEAFASYGQIDSGAVAQPLRAPGDVIPQFGGLEVTTSSTALQSLSDAVLYLVAYPFECSEQLSSRVLGIAALRDVLAAFQAPGLPEPKALEAAVARDLERLRRIQNEDGGFAFWRRGDPSWPYLSIHVALAMERAKAKGFAVPDEMLDPAHEYLKDIEQRIPANYPGDVRRTLIAYALYVRQRLGDSDATRARKLLRETGVDKLSFEALGWLLPVLGPDAGSRVEAELIRRRLASSVSETAAAAHFAVSYGEEGAYLLLHSNRRVDAIVLEALIRDQPKNDLIPKLVEGLLGHRNAGRWENTQENVFVLLALDRYFQAYEKTTPDFVARLWLGERFASEHAFQGRNTERRQLDIPMTALAEQGRANLLLAKQGAGRLYYRIGLRYAPASLRLEPADHGFALERSYEAVDDPADVRRDGDGVWRVRAGARVRVKLKLAAPGRRTHVALVDPLPAGLEALNPALAVTGTLPEGEKDTVLGWWRRTWYDHQNLRDERVEAFASLLFEGVYAYSYVARATTPGTFVVPPTKAEEMYHPETFGRSGTDRVVVE